MRVSGRLMSGNLRPTKRWFRINMSCCSGVSGPRTCFNGSTLDGPFSAVSTARVTSSTVYLSQFDEICLFVHSKVRISFTVILHAVRNPTIVRSTQDIVVDTAENEPSRLAPLRTHRTFWMRKSWSISLSPGKRGWPSTSSPMMQPIAHMSTSRTAALRRSTQDVKSKSAENQT